MLVIFSPRPLTILVSLFFMDKYVSQMCPCGHPELIQNETQELEQPTTNIYTNQMFILNYWVKIETSSNTVRAMALLLYRFARA